MNIQLLTDGNLEISAVKWEQAAIKKLNRIKWLNGYAKEAAFIAQFLRPQYQQTSPCSVGALTDAPLVTDGITVWGFMNYQVESFLETLASGGTTTWQKG